MSLEKPFSTQRAHKIAHILSHECDHQAKDELSFMPQKNDRALHFLLKDQVTLAPDAKHQLWSVYE